MTGLRHYDLTAAESVINRALNSDKPGEVIGQWLGHGAERGPLPHGRGSVKKRHAQRMDAIEQIYLSAIRRPLAHAQLEVLHKLHKGSQSGVVKNTDTAPAAVDFMFDLNDFKKMFFAGMRQAAEDALQVSGQGLLSELGIDKKYVTPHGLIHDFTIDRANKLSGVPDEVYDTVKAALEGGAQRGETMDELAQRVQDAFTAVDEGRAHVIARTETASAYNTARLDSMKQAGFEKKSWLTAHDERVRVSHSECESEGAIPVDGTFSNGLAYPGDPSGPPGEVINCRCVLQAED